MTETAGEPLSAAEQAVLSALADGEKHVSELAAASGMRQGELSAALILLEMKGLIASCGWNRYKKI